MARNYELVKSAFSRQLGRGVNILVEFSHSQFTSTFRLCDNTAPITTAEGTFEPFPFKYVLNTQGETQGASIVLGNIDRQVAREIRRATNNESIVCRVWIANIEKIDGNITASTYDAGTFEVFTPTITPETVTLNLNLRLSLEFNQGKLRYNQTNFPNLYL